MSYVFPDDYDTSRCYLVAINAALVPLVAGALELFQQRYAWQTDEDYERGYNAFAALRACMMRTCIDDLIESNDRLYRMLDTAIFGRQYSVISTDPLEVSPAIAPTHDLVIEDNASALGRMETLQQLLDNALNGTETPQFDRADGVRDLLEQIRDSLATNGELDDDMLAKLIEIAALLA